MNNILFRERKWIIMSKDRTLVARGVPRDRYLVRVDDTKDNKRILSYNSKRMAEAGFMDSGFYSDEIPQKDENGIWINQDTWRKKNLEAVPVIITIEEVQDES